MGKIHIARTSKRKTWIESPACRDFDLNADLNNADLVYCQEPHLFDSLVDIQQKMIWHIDDYEVVVPESNALKVCFSEFGASQYDGVFLMGGMFGMNHTLDGLVLGRYRRRMNYSIYQANSLLVVYDSKITAEWVDEIKRLAAMQNWQVFGYSMDGKPSKMIERDRTEKGIDWCLDGAEVVVYLSHKKIYPRIVGIAMLKAIPVVVLKYGANEISKAVPSFYSRPTLEKVLKPLLFDQKHRREVGTNLYFDAAKKTQMHRSDYANLITANLKGEI